MTSVNQRVPLRRVDGAGAVPGATLVWDGMYWRPTSDAVLEAAGFKALGWDDSADGGRFVGGNTSGPPTTGTYQQRDFIVTTDGEVWICVLAGSPGTWVNASGGGGVGDAGWVTVVDSNPMSSTTGWTTRNGTWTTGAYGVEQTDGGASNVQLEYGTDVPTAALVMEATIRFPSAAPSGTKLGFTMGNRAGTPEDGAQMVWLREDGKVETDRWGVGGAQFTLAGGALTRDQDYVFRAVRHGSNVDVWINGAFIVTGTWDIGNHLRFVRCGLSVGAGRGWFRDVSIWRFAVPGD